MFRENRLAWDAWQVLNIHGRPPGPLVPHPTNKKMQMMMKQPISVSEAVSYLDGIDATQEDLDKVLLIEHIVYPSLNK